MMTSERRRRAAVIPAIVALLVLAHVPTAAQTEPLSITILANPDFPVVVAQAKSLLKTGLNAGGGYGGEVWIRDLNTFIELALDTETQPAIRTALLTFMQFQNPDFGIPDAYTAVAGATGVYEYAHVDDLPQLAAFKNTVETDQESSLVQAVARYVRKTGDRTILDEMIHGEPVRTHLAHALRFPLEQRFNAKFGLLWGATTIDWGDVQPETNRGTTYDRNASHPAIDVYDNAMFILAVDSYLDLVGPSGLNAAEYKEAAAQLRNHVRTYLWDAARHKFRPHLYVNGSPFPPDFDEDRIYYHGGTAVAIEAGLLTNDEIRLVLSDMVNDKRFSGAASIGLTIYPTYPDGWFKNPMVRPFAYQNGGDWTWFGGRMIQQLVAHGFVAEAYEEILPMVARVQRDHGFFEWYTIGNEPRGSGAYRGAAGVLGRAIEMLVGWADAHRSTPPRRE